MARKKSEKPEKVEEPGNRSDDLSGREGIKDKLIEVFQAVEKGFENQTERADDLMDYWDIYNCKLGGKQFYSGNSEIFIPIVYNAVNARKTRFTNQIFPVSGRNVEVTTSDRDLPHAEMALAESYVRKSRLRDLVPALCVNGDVEGQYNVYVEWVTRKRHVAMRVKRPVKLTEEEEAFDVEAEEVDDIEEQVVTDSFPRVEILSDTDICVLPATADSVIDAIEQGGSVTIIRRWGKARLQRLIDDGEILEDEGEALIAEMTKVSPTTKDKAKEMVDAAGIRGAGSKHAQVYETWTKLEVDGEQRICKAYYGGESRVLGCKLNPLWCDRIPLLSAPVNKVVGSFKGMSKIKFCADMQYAANDAVNEGMDSAAYALMPIVMTDPEKNPRVGSMVLAQAAIWETSPQDTQFAQFPKLWTDAFEIVANAKAEVATALSVSPAALTQQTSKKKMNQAEMANEQQVDVLSTADAVTVIEEGILTPMLTLFMELDHQYRDNATLVRQYGEMGMRASIEEIPPLQMDNHYQFKWVGVEAARNAQQVQQQIAATNVLRGIPPQQYPGFTLDLTPVITQLVENVFGPRLAPLVFVNQKHMQTVDPELENTMLEEGYDLPVHPPDNDPEHMQAHMDLLKRTGDPYNVIQIHIQRHQQAMMVKNQQAMQQQGPQGQGAPQGQPGVPGGAGPGVAGTPRIGAQPLQPRNGQAPPGAIHPDQMIDPQKAPEQ